MSVSAILGLSQATGQSLLVGFEDVGLGSPATESYTGPGGGVYHNGSDLSGGFSSGGVSFENSFTDWGGGFTSWSGWGYSTTTDTVTGDFTNQYSAFAGSAFAGQTYGVVYHDAYTAPSVLLDLPTGWEAPESIALVNTTYAALTMTNGDAFAKVFGQGDYFKVTLQGLDAGGASTGAVDHYLADFRGSVETHYIQAVWETVDLTALGSSVDKISITFESSDVGAFGMNTPAYLAVDNLTLGATPVPEPQAFALMAGIGCLALLILRRRA